jgi:hypothetical protein
MDLTTRAYGPRPRIRRGGWIADGADSCRGKVQGPGFAGGRTDGGGSMDRS